LATESCLQFGLALSARETLHGWNTEAPWAIRGVKAFEEEGVINADLLATTLEWFHQLNKSAKGGIN